MRILMVSSELAPYASTGDLGDAVGALARGLARRGHQVVAVLPEYGPGPDPSLFEPAPADPSSSAPPAGAASLRQPEGRPLGLLGEVPTTAGPRRVSARIEPPVHPYLQVVRLQCPPLYDRPGVYGSPEDYGDNPDRFWVLSAGAMSSVRRMGWTPDIAHGHDWHTGWLPAILRSQADFQSVRTVHTGYDLRMSGSAPLGWAAELGVVHELLKPEGIEYFGQVSFAKAGLRFADIVVMSSPEANDPEEGLTGVVRARGAAVARIPRSIDAAILDPEHDLGLPSRFSARSVHGKQTCKRRLQAAMGLEVNPDALLILMPDEPAPAITPPLPGPVQWLSLDGLSDGLTRLAFAGADALFEPSADPWSGRCLAAERYGVATLIAHGPDLPVDAYGYDRHSPNGLGETVARVLRDFSDIDRWREGVRARLSNDPERGIARYETLYRQVLLSEAGDPVPWAVPSLRARLEGLGR